MLTYAEYLRGSTINREVVDLFLDSSKNRWAVFDPEVGYILGNSMPRDGIDNSRTISTAAKNGARTQRNYTDKPCRINTYGNSFTQCHQVSDGETWQEYLASHLGEPVRNYGMGGFGVYQAYRRMIRAEQSADGSEHVILFIWGDDHHRAVMRCRHAAIYPWFNCNDGVKPLHGNFWANIEMDLDAGKLAERESLCPTPQSMYNMCDPEFMYESLRDDLMVQLYFIRDLKDKTNLKERGISLAAFKRLADILGVPFNDACDDCLFTTFTTLRDKYAYAATKHTLAMSRAFTEAHGKKLLVASLDPRVNGAMRPLMEGQPRIEQEIVDFLNDNGFNYFDMNEVHARDFKCFNLSYEDYCKRYFIGAHYRPTGNHFFAYSIKDKLIEMLDPKPATYSDTDGKYVYFL